MVSMLHFLELIFYDFISYIHDCELNLLKNQISEGGVEKRIGCFDGDARSVSPK